MKALTLSAALLLSALSVHAAPPAPAALALDALLQHERVEVVHAQGYPDGLVEIMFGSSVDDAEHLRIVEKLRAHPDIHTVKAYASPRTFCRID
jgi:hypothetical protein